ncbi:MAG: hypothetical protein EA357_01635 [Micavibrio sp.]|nr:MAG: hypothetical protein EA357_01635 [Micavibrio sp.]
MTQKRRTSPVPAFARRSQSQGGEKPASRDNAASKKNGRWNLKNLYPGLRSRALKQDQSKVEEKLAEFLYAYQDSVFEDMPGAELAEAIAAYEEIQNRKSLISSYAALLSSDNSKNYEKVKPLERWAGFIDSKLEPFLEALSGMKEDKLLFKLAAPEMSPYAPWLAQLRAGAAGRNLPEEIENLSAVFQGVTTDGLSALYQKKAIAVEEKMAAVETAGRSIAEIRDAQAKILKQHSGGFADMLGTLIKSQDVNRTWYGHSRQDQDFLDRNNLEAETADMIFDTVKKSYIALSHRYYKWVAAQHGEDVLPAHKLSELTPGAEKAKDFDFAWDEAEKEVLSSFRKFSPKFANTAKGFFEGGYIDALPHAGKATSDFTYPTGPLGHPFVLTNFDGSLDALVVLAHELGHGIHMKLAEEAQGGLLSETPETLAEVASVFSEMLLFDYLRGKTDDPDTQRRLLEQQITGLLESAMQQMAYYDFEKRVYAQSQNGMPDAETISDIWVDVLQDYYGPSVEIDDYQRYSWTMVPHFFEMPSFYVFSYSFAQGMVNSLYKIYRDSDDKAEFVENYTALLQAGMSTDVKELLQPFGLDHTTQDFWRKGLELIEDYLNELETGAPPPVPTDAPMISDILGTGKTNEKKTDTPPRKNFRFKP